MDLVDATTRNALDTIRERLGPNSTDWDAAETAVRALAGLLTGGTIPLTPTLYNRYLVDFAERMVSIYAGEVVRLTVDGAGAVHFDETGEPLPDPNSQN